MWKRKLIRNKIFSLILIGVGALSFPIEHNATIFLCVALFAVPLFFAKQNWIPE